MIWSGKLNFKVNIWYLLRPLIWENLLNITTCHTWNNILGFCLFGRFENWDGLTMSILIILFRLHQVFKITLSTIYKLKTKNINCKDIGIELLSVDIRSAKVYQLRWKIITNTDQETYFFFFGERDQENSRWSFWTKPICAYIRSCIPLCSWTV